MAKLKISEKPCSEVTKKVVGTQIPMELYERLMIESERDFMSISDYLRKIIILHFRRIDKGDRN